jgi:hypothetical protein
MDQVVATHELAYQPWQAMAHALGYDREAIAFLGLSHLKGVGFQTLASLGDSMRVDGDREVIG